MKSSFAIYDPNIGARLTLALLMALIFHALVILGIGFSTLPSPYQEPVFSLNVTLVEQADGNPGKPPTSIADDLNQSDFTEQVAAQPPTVESLPAKVTDPAPLVSTRTVPKVVLPKPGKDTLSEPAIVKSPPPAPGSNLPPRPPLSKPTATTPHAMELMNRGLEMARLDSISPPKDNTREKRIDRESMTTLEKFYLQAWERKVEQIGTLNFPEEARRFNLTNGPILDVAVRADGSVHSVYLMRSSGHPALDQAARRIVELAAPFAPFPKELRQQYDILHIVRKWKFEHGKLLQ
jgi:protein TonB